MPVNRLPQTRTSREAGATAQRTAEMQLQFVLANLHHLQKVDKAEKMEKAAKDFKRDIDHHLLLTPGQLSYVDGIYEATMRGAGYPSAALHFDKKRRGLKYG